MDGSKCPGGVKHMDDVLAHYGVKGMKWGVRRSNPSASVPASADKQMANETKAKIKVGGTKSLSNEELRRYLERMDLEKRYKSSNPPTFKSETQKFIKDTLINIGKQEVAKFAAKEVTKILSGK